MLKELWNKPQRSGARNPKNLFVESGRGQYTRQIHFEHNSLFGPRRFKGSAQAAVNWLGG